MELRKVEQELERLSNEWKSLRRKNPFFDGENAGTESINGIVSSAATADVISGEPMQPATGTATLLPSLKELSLRIDDKDIYPTPPPESEDDESDTKMGVEVEGERKGTDGNLPECAAVEKSVIFKVDDSTKDSKPVENGTSATKVNSVEFDAQVETTQNQDASDNEEEEIKTMEAESPEKVLANLDFLRESILTLKAKNDKFCKRLIEKDPITKKPRYGDKTAIRVKKVIRRFKTLELGVSIAFNDPEFSDLNPTVSVQYNHMSDVSNSTTATEGLVAKLRMQIQQHNEKIQSKLHAKKTKELMEAERIARERVIAEQTIIEQQRLEEEKKREEELILAQRAQEMRQRRAEEEQRALEAEREADRQLLELVPVKGPEGVRVQLNRMRESLKDDKKALDVALVSLYTLFDQIVRKPEEVNFRRIRRDHPKFMEDIGRHVGGREILIAAGFHLEKLDGVPSFFSREPHIETDMDGWSAWFDGLKRTLEILEEEMIK